jgi:DNA-binding MarR family transcriptional regulator
MDRAANLLGALSLVLADRVDDAVTGIVQTTRRPDRSVDSAATALSAMHHFLHDPSIDQLAKVLGLTPSGAVRLVDRLVGAGHVERRPGGDGRTVQLRLTVRGRYAALGVSEARGLVLDRALDALSGEERATFAELAGRMLAGMIRPSPGTTRWMCRICDTGACERDAGRCPVANAVSSAAGRPAEDSGARASGPAT